MRRQEGQILPIFALSAIVIVGIVALAIDFGFLSDQHRNLQAAADSAAEAGARELTVAPTDTDRTAARTAAFIYLRDNLHINASTSTGCNGGGGSIDLTTDVSNCALNGTIYTISIQTPGNPAQVMSMQRSWTISVSVSEVVSSALAGAAFGAGSNQAAASATAMFNHAQHFPFAGYTQGCIQTGTHLELIGGNVGINSNPQSGCQPAATLCVESTTSQPGGDGDIIFGQDTTDPLVVLPNTSPATCTAGSSGQVLATGSILHATVAPPPGLAPPPAVTGSSTFPPPADCFYTLSACTPPGAAACTNGVDPGVPGQQCFQPGTYNTLDGVANNLNPGVYYIAGPAKGSACWSAPPCKDGITFTGNTINANWQDVRHQCWKAPNNADTWTYTTTACPSTAQAPMVDGLVFDPTTPLDPMCPYNPGLVAPTAPSITVTPNASGGNLASGVYYVRVTATNSLGETDTAPTPYAVTVASLTNQGSITVSGQPMAGASTYVIYGPSTVDGQEQRYGTMSATVASSVTLTDITPAYPLTNGAGGGVVAPTFSASAGPGGSLPATTYYVRVSATTSSGETDTNEQSVIINGSSSNRVVTLSITAQAGASGYRVYGPSTSPNTEPYYGTIPGPGTPGPISYTLDHVPPSTGAYPTTNSTSNGALPNPTFTLTPTTAGGSLNGTYWVKVTAVNANGETLGTEQSSVVVNPASDSLSLQIVRVNGATGYNVYGPSTSSGTELWSTLVTQPVSGNPTPVNLTGVGTGAAPPQIVNTTGCSATGGFYNLPNGPSKNYGVTIVLGGNASFCLNASCDPTASNPPVVMLSPACYSGFRYDATADQYVCNAPVSGALQDDGAFTIYGTSNGLIQATGPGGPWTMTGTMYAPNATLNVGPADPTGCNGVGQLKFGMIPGQFIVGTAHLCTGNVGSPVAWWTGRNGAAIPTTVQLIR